MARGRAKIVLQQVSPSEVPVADRPGEMDERDVDERFASIVARWEGSVPDASAPTDETSGSDGAPDAPADAPADEAAVASEDSAEPPTARAVRPPWVNPSPLEVVVPASSWRSEPPADDDTRAAAAAAEAELDDEHYEPPPVVLPPQEDLHFWGAVIGLVAGPLMLLYVVFARPFHSTRWFIASVVVSLVGFGLLVLRQPRSRDELDGDDGARV